MRRTEGELERSETTMIFSKGEERFGDRGREDCVQFARKRSLMELG